MAVKPLLSHSLTSIIRSWHSLALNSLSTASTLPIFVNMCSSVLPLNAKIIFLHNKIINLLPLLSRSCKDECRLPTCYPHWTYYCRCWSATAHTRAGWPPVIHIGHITAAVDQLLHKQKSRLPSVIHIGDITASVMGQVPKSFIVSATLLVENLISMFFNGTCNSIFSNFLEPLFNVWVRNK